MNPFIAESKRLLAQHGVTVSFIAVTEGTYDVETGTTTNTEASISIKAFPKKVRTTQFVYPNLIGMDVLEFVCVATDFNTPPNKRDKITYNSATYSIEEIKTHVAYGEVTLYKFIAVKG